MSSMTVSPTSLSQCTFLYLQRLWHSFFIVTQNCRLWSMQPDTYLPMWNFILSYSHWWFWLSLKKSRDGSEVPLCGLSWNLCRTTPAFPQRGSVWKQCALGIRYSRASPGCSLLLTPFFLHSIPSTVPCFPHSPLSSALVSSDCVCIFLLWHSTFSENHASGETLDLAQKPLHFLQVGPAQYVLETELDSLVFVHTLGSGLWIPHFQQACHHIFYYGDEWNPHSYDWNISDH